MPVRPRGATSENVGFSLTLETEGSPDMKKPSAEWRSGLHRPLLNIQTPPRHAWKKTSCYK